MNLKDFRLDVEALFSRCLYGHGYLHYGYWKHGVPKTASLEELGKAQAEYFNKLIEVIPNDVKSILDVGSGTGSNAFSLINKGYSVDCVCPSQNLNNIASKKLPTTSTIFTGKFEEFTSEKHYDMLLFAESFHYIHADVALEKGINYAKKYILIFDYYRKKDSKNYQRISYNQFSKLLIDSFGDSYEVIRDEDVTQYIAPTFFVLDEISNNDLKPFLNTTVSQFKQENPIYGFLFRMFLNKITRFSNKKSNRYEDFVSNNEYRIVLLSKKDKT